MHGCHMVPVLFYICLNKKTMKKLIPLILFATLISCKKTTVSENRELKDTLSKIDSINSARTQYNDSIKALNDKNRFGDLSGTHALKYSSDGGATLNGGINFNKTGRDLYEVSGNARSGNNILDINGTIKRVSEKHLNFEGKISQKINGSTYNRTKKTTFLDEGKGKFWRLQDKVNGEGFVDYIDIQY